MTIQVTTDRNIEGSERLSTHVKDVVSNALHRFSEQLTNVVVHLSDENAGKKGPDDKRCTIEAHYKGIQPVAAVNHANTTEDAVKGATQKIKSSLDSITERLRNH